VDHLRGITPQLCDQYPQPLEPSFNRLSRMEANTRRLREMKPNLRATSVEGILEELGKIAPLLITSGGPTYQDREMVGTLDT
jgi:hypothetical protein